jgi:hypothetical protein
MSEVRDQSTDYDKPIEYDTRHRHLVVTVRQLDSIMTAAYKEDPITLYDTVYFNKIESNSGIFDPITRLKVTARESNGESWHRRIWGRFTLP